MPVASLPLPADPVRSATVIGLQYSTSDSPGIVRQRRGRGFVYLRPDGHPVRRPADLRRIRALAIPPAWKQVWICAAPDGHLQAVGRDARDRKQYRYHPLYRRFRNETKFYRMLEFGQTLPALRKQVTRDLLLPGLPRRKVLATVVRLLEATMIRVGNEHYARANHSRGLTTMTNRNVTVDRHRIRFYFKGKSGLRHEVQLEDPRLARVVRRCRDLPGQELFQYRGAGGESCAVGSADVNDYLRALTGQDFTAKDFRTWQGSVLAARCLVESGPCHSQADGKRKFLAAVRHTAGRLGNQPSTCRNYYIHPVIAEAYLDGTLCELAGRLNGRPPARISKDERLVIELLRRRASDKAKEIVRELRAA